MWNLEIAMRNAGEITFISVHKPIIQLRENEMIPIQDTVEEKSFSFDGSTDLTRALSDSHNQKFIFSMKELVQAFELILDDVYSGIILCDKDSKVLFMNKFYADLLGTNKAKAIGKHIKAFFPHSRLPSVVETGEMELLKRCSLRADIALLVNRVPIIRKGETIGVVLQTVFKNHKEIGSLLARLSLLEKEVSHYKRGLNSVLSATYNFDSIIGNNLSIKEAKKMAAKYAKTQSSVLILGQTGTGKELFAHATHLASPRSAGAFVCVNCAAIPRELLESELLGYETGAFTGASRKGKEGKIQLAHEGTLFLDEIGDLPLNAQAKLLRVLETKKIEKLGGIKIIHVDFRLIAATNKNLRGMIDRHEFREDLFYRLNTMCVEIPALSDRTDDIPILIDYFLHSMGKPDFVVNDSAMERLKAYPWPGNVRELKNMIARAVSLAEGVSIGCEHLPNEIRSDVSGSASAMKITGDTLSHELACHEKNVLIEALKSTRGNMTKTAKLLGIARSTLYEKCRIHNL